MEITSFEHIECKSISIVDEERNARVHISTDDNGGRISIVDNQEAGGGFNLCFDLGQPSITILDKDGKLCFLVTVDAEGGFLNISGKDGKTKILLFVENSRGCIVSGEDVYNFS